ncbi:hypothetical protein [Cellulomonas sp.]|uniref:hypothetical protein n=1 Tax=Cellulomonas sp. TaxID=40001 RepID=UPI002811EA57|nr:hypothetical protein [Cellulomonas sp.]
MLVSAPQPLVVAAPALLREVRLVLLVTVVVAALVLLLVPSLRDRLMGEWLVHHLARRYPRERRAQFRRDLRAAARGGPFVPLPPGTDPSVPTTRVEVPPLGDGRPGERFLAPGPADQRGGTLSEDGSRQDAVVPLGPGRALLVVCLGRVGRASAAGPLEVASDRPGMHRALASPDVRHLADVERVAGPDGAPAWRATYAVGNAVVTDTHVDRDGWAFVVGVLRRAGQSDLDGLADAVLRTWQWLPDEPGRPTTHAAVDLPADPAATPGVLTVHGHDGRPVARCRCAAPPTAWDVPAPDGTWTAAYVRLTPTASLTVTSAPGALDGGRAARAHLDSPPVLPFGPDVVPLRESLPVRTAAGPAWARAFRVGSGRVRGEVRLDRGDQTWAWLLTHAPGEEAQVRPALDAVLASWEWLDGGA